MSKIFKILLNAMPVLLMIFLITMIKNDFILAGFFVLIIFVSLSFKYKRNDFLFLAFGFFVMTAFEYLFISTGVETFSNRTLLGAMPLWLPFIWSYGFVALKRSIEILNQQVS